MHPETEKPLPMLFRTSGFVPINIPMVIGLSILPPTVKNNRYNFIMFILFFKAD